MLPDAAKSLIPSWWPLPRALVGLCTEVYIKLRSPEGQEQEEGATQGQEHLFNFYDELSEEQKRALDNDYDSFKDEEYEEAWEHSQNKNTFLSADPPLMLNWEVKRPPTPGKGANLTRTSDVGERKLTSWRNTGLELYFKSRVAIVILSGGRDSRLSEGIPGGVPKGVLDIGLLSGKSIFQLYFERVLRLQHLVQRKFKRAVAVPIYIMCNSDNRAVIEEFFDQNGFFGVREQDVLFFNQGNWPVCDSNGKILLREKHRIAQEPNGNGGVFKALVDEGMISDMKSRGVLDIYVSSIDNVLTKVGDPCFLGYCEVCKAEAGLKCVEKVSPDEPFGVFCSKSYRPQYEDVDGDGRLDMIHKVRAGVVEFFELPDDLKRRRLRVGTSGATPLALNAGNISQYYFKVDFVKKVQPFMNKRWHAIPKSISHIHHKTGQTVSASVGRQKNANRLEMFIFDAFEAAQAVVGLEVDRSEFANVKNITGPDSPQTALMALGRLHQQWILAAGGIFAERRISTEREDNKCEVSPLVSYDGEDLGGQFPNAIQLPFYQPSMQELTQFSAASSKDTRRPVTDFLDKYSELAEHELNLDMQFGLAPVMAAIGDPLRREYAGERADEDEVLPLTPRQGKPVTANEFRRMGSGDSDPPHNDPTGPAPVSAREKEPEKPAENLEPEHQDFTGGSPRHQGGKVRAKPVDKRRDAFWGDPSGQAEATLARKK